MKVITTKKKKKVGNWMRGKKKPGGEKLKIGYKKEGRKLESMWKKDFEDMWGGFRG